MTAQKHCLRASTRSERAWFHTKAEAEAFGGITPGYEGDVAHLCATCGFWHLARREWLENPEYFQTVSSFSEGSN
jgi:hypothetical protein